MIEYIQTLFKGSWELLTTVKFPGTEMSLAVILIGSFVCVFSIRLLGYFISLNPGFGASASNVSSITKRIDK